MIAAFGSQLLQLARGDESRHAGHRDIHDDNVGLECQCLFDRRLPVARLGDDSHVRLSFDNQFETVADGHVIIGEQNAQARRVLVSHHSRSCS